MKSLVFLAALCPLLWFSQIPSASGQNLAGSASETKHLVDFSFDELTWSSVDVSPDGRTILFDALGDLFLIPIEGGNARLLRGGPDWDMMPRFSPDGKDVIFATNHAGGPLEIWSVSLSDGHLAQQIASEDGNDLIFPQSDALCGGVVSQTRWVMGAEVSDSGKIGLKWKIGREGANCSASPLVAGAEFPTLTRDGKQLYFAINGRIDRLDRTDENKVSAVLKPAAGERLTAPQVSPDGHWLAFVSIRDEKKSLKIADLRRLDEIDLGRADHSFRPSSSFTPDSKFFLTLLDGKIRKIDLESRRVSTVAFAARFSQAMPKPPVPKMNLAKGDISISQFSSFSAPPSGRSLYFSAAGRLWKRDLKTGLTREIFASFAGRKFSPVVSPDGRQIAYVRWLKNGAGELVIARSSGAGPLRRIGRPGLFMAPTWSPDSSKVAFIEFRPNEAKFSSVRQGTMDLYLADLEVGSIEKLKENLQIVESLNHPVTPLTFSTDGREIYFIEGVSRQAVVVNLISKIAIDSKKTDEVLALPRSGASLIRLDLARNSLVYGDLEGLRVAPFDAIARLGVDIGEGQIASLSAGVEGAFGVDNLGDCPAGICWSRGKELFAVQPNGRSGAIATLDLSLRAVTPRRTFAFVGANVITMTGATLNDQTILIEDGRIKSVRPRSEAILPPRTGSIDVTGYTIIPGFIDTHAHPALLGDIEYGPAQRPAYLSNLAYGVTTTAELSGGLSTISDATEIDAGTMVGPRLLSVGYPFTDLQDSIGFSPKLNGYEDALRYVRALKSHGASMIKSYDISRHDVRSWIVDAARAEHMPVFTHYQQVPWGAVVAASEGHNGLEHMTSMPKIRQDWAKFFGESGSTLTPTLFNAMYDKWNPYCSLWRKIEQVPEKANNFVSVEDIDRQIGRGCQDHLPPTGQWVDDMLNIIAQGGNVSQGGHGELQGPDVHVELKALVEYGMTPLQALETYTVRGARKLGVENQIGKILPGYLADLQVISGNPSQDISQIGNIKYVMVRGILYDADTMRQIWPRSEIE